MASGRGCSILRVSAWLLAAAAAPVVALAVLVLLLRRIAQAVGELRDQLMQLSAAAVAGEELVRATRDMADHAAETRAAARTVRNRLRRRQRPETLTTL